MDYQPTSLGAFGLDWEKATGDDAVAREVVAFLQDQRVLYDQHDSLDILGCIASANKSRTFLTDELMKARTGESLAAGLRAMRAALRTFIDTTGPDGRNVRGHSEDDSDLFSRALGTLHALISMYLAVIVDQYGIEIRPEFAKNLRA